MNNIRVAIAGIGNCARSLVQAVGYYRDKEPDGCITPDILGWRPGDIDFVVGFDVDERKVGSTIDRAIESEPNCAWPIASDLRCDAPVLMGPILDGVAHHMLSAQAHRGYRVEADRECDVVAELIRHDAEVLVCYMPVGSQGAVEFYARAALLAKVAFVNCVPVFIASNSDWRERFATVGVPLIGDDVKSQFGATILHRAVLRLASYRGLRVTRTYQLNTGGNTDFLNMTDRARVIAKKRSKTQSAVSQVGHIMAPDEVYIGPSDYIPWLGDTKIAFIRMEAEGVGGVPVELEMRLRVEDSPNSAGVVLDAIRYAAVARGKGIGGALYWPSAALMKSPPLQLSDEIAADACAQIAAGLMSPAATPA